MIDFIMFPESNFVLNNNTFGVRKNKSSIFNNNIPLN